MELRWKCVDVNVFVPMPRVPRETTLHVKEACLCLAAQRAARALARRFDAAFRRVGLTNGQFSILHALNREAPPGVGQVAELLAMDRTTLTAALKPLVRRRLVAIKPDPNDGRSRRLGLTTKGHAALATAMPIWRAEHQRVERGLADLDALRRGLGALGAARQAVGSARIAASRHGSSRK